MTPTEKTEAYNRKHLALGDGADVKTITQLVLLAQATLGLDVDGMCGPKTKLAVLERIGELMNAPAPAPKLEIIDRRKFAIQAHGPEREWKVTDRDWSKVTGITLHQTACLLGERPERWDTCGAHVGITRSGKVIWLHDFDREVAHGNGWNARCVGIEIDGLFAGIEGDPKTVWDNPSTPQREQGMALTPEQAEAARQAVRWICSEVAQAGGKITALVAHRQSSDTRRNDPGEAIWKAVALPVRAELGLSDGGRGFKIGDGYPIPEAWDPSRAGIRY